MVRAMVGTRLKPKKCTLLVYLIALMVTAIKNKMNDPHIMQNCPDHKLHGKLVTKRPNAS